MLLGFINFSKEAPLTMVDSRKQDKDRLNYDRFEVAHPQGLWVD